MQMLHRGMCVLLLVLAACSGPTEHQPPRTYAVQLLGRVVDRLGEVKDVEQVTIRRWYRCVGDLGDVPVQEHHGYFEAVVTRSGSDGEDPDCVRITAIPLPGSGFDTTVSPSVIIQYNLPGLPPRDTVRVDLVLER